MWDSWSGSTRRGKILVKRGKATNSPQVIVKMENIKFEKCPLYPVRFDILKIESKKKENSL
jgi:hypothetical protein